MAPTRKATKTHDVMGRPRHRLFGVFDDPAVGRAAVEKYSAGLHAGEDDIWSLYGEEGLQNSTSRVGWRASGEGSSASWSSP